MTKTYNTPKRTHIVKTRLDDEEHAEFLHRMELLPELYSDLLRTIFFRDPHCVPAWQNSRTSQMSFSL